MRPADTAGGRPVTRCHSLGSIAGCPRSTRTSRFRRGREHDRIAQRRIRSLYEAPFGFTPFCADRSRRRGHVAVDPDRLTRTSATERKGATDHETTDWIIIAASGQVTLGLSQPEVGQGSYTALPQILADELDADWKRVEVQFVTGRPAYKIAFRQEAPVQKEGASMSTTVLYERLRTAGAAAREVLTRAAAQTWGIDVAACRTENGFVINERGEKLSYGQLARRRRQASAERAHRR